MDDNEILEQAEEQKPLIIETKGKWQPFEAMTCKELETGKTYHIKVAGHCQFMISKERPMFGFGANEIDYTKDADNKLWIKTGG